MNKKISTTLAFSVIIILAIFLAGISFYLWKGIKIENNPIINIPKKNKPVACTEEAKICPDGSYVGRTAPNCEFAPCPEIVGIANKIIITSLKPNDEIASPVLILGSAVGGWFFEGDFPGEVYDDNDKKLGSHFCSFISKSENNTWMTENFVDFRCEINFDEPKTEKGYLLFKKDNPSNIRELDEEFKLPVKFSEQVSVSDWQIYRNEEYGFEVKYPKDFIKQKVVSEGNLLYLKKEEAGGIYISVSIRKSYQVDRALSNVTAEEMVIEGKRGYKYFYREGVGYSGVFLLQLKNDSLQLTYDYIGSEKEKSSIENLVSNNFNQILSI